VRRLGQRSSGKSPSKWGLALFLAVFAWCVLPAWGRSPPTGVPLESVSLASLPTEARETWQRVLNGGPFPYAKDGAVFGNRERLLPAHPRGFYREYTVRTPGAHSRSARRIVCGGRQPTGPEDCYYTDDHYASFRHIEP
jgi:ribonuclease T1